MNLNKLEKLEPYKDIDGDLGISYGIGMDEINLNLTGKQRRLLEKLETQKEQIEKNFPNTKEDFKTGVRQAVKNIKTCYKYDTNVKIQKELIKHESHIGTYYHTKSNSEFELYGRFIGAIDAKLDSIQNSIEVEKCFNRTDPNLNNKKQELLTLREKVVNGYLKETDTNIELYKILIETIKNYPSYTKFGELYQEITYGIGPHVMNLVTYFCSSYNDGYANGVYLSTEELEEEYENSILALSKEKERNQEEYNKQIKRIRR